jgi:hypothetical protein
MGLVCDPRELPGVKTARPRVAGVLQKVGKRVVISLMGPAYNPELCHGPHTIPISLWIRGNVVYRGWAQIFLITTI